MTLWIWKGISREADILELAASSGVIQKSGAWFAYDNAKIGQGRENAKTYLMEHRRPPGGGAEGKSVLRPEWRREVRDTSGAENSGD